MPYPGILRLSSCTASFAVCRRLQRRLNAQAPHLVWRVKLVDRDRVELGPSTSARATVLASPASGRQLRKGVPRPHAVQMIAFDLKHGGVVWRKDKPGRKIMGMAAILLPFEADGRIAEDAYAACPRDTVNAGLTPAVNMDTGYVNLLTDSEIERILQLTRETLRGAPFVAGAFIEGQDGDVVDLYRREIARIAGHGGAPILFQTSRLHNLPAREVICAYAHAVADVPIAYGFELGRMFAPNGEIWSSEVAEGIMPTPQIKGMKHSSLDRVLELECLALRDRVRPDFQIFTGNDLGIDMIEYGSDYLLGLAAFSPSKFAERDSLWEARDTGYFAVAVADALQMLGNIAFRPPVPAYKHSAAIFLHLLGKIPSSRTHPRSPERPKWEHEILADCARRLNLL